MVETLVLAVLGERRVGGDVRVHEVRLPEVVVARDARAVRLERFALREDLVKGFSEIRAEMAALRVELLRWSFAFWIGQVAATAGLMALLIRLLTP